MKRSIISKNDIKSVAIGRFDGIHKGHKELFKELGESAALVVIETQKMGLTPGARREEYAQMPCFYYDLSDIKNLRGDEFIKMLEADFPNLEKIVVGYDFKFGKDRAWDKHDLKRLFSGEVAVVSEFCFDGLGVHSSAIKRLLSDGDIYRANRLLGREYSIAGRVIKGQGIGKKELVATLNLDTGSYILPKDCVYATRTKIGQITYNSITFLGNRLSTDEKFSVETHLLGTDFGENSSGAAGKSNLNGESLSSENLNGDLNSNLSDIRVCFIERIRNNAKFSELKELKKQIERDIIIAKNVAISCDLSIDEKISHTRDLAGILA